MFGMADQAVKGAKVDLEPEAVPVEVVGMAEVKVAQEIPGQRLTAPEALAVVAAAVLEQLTMEIPQCLKFTR